MKRIVLILATLLLAAGTATFFLLRHSGERRREPAWSGGFAAPPPWLPFGDPATQYGAASFIDPLARMIASLPSTQPLSRRLVLIGQAIARAAAALVAP